MEPGDEREPSCAVSVAGKSADDIRAMPAPLKGAAVLQQPIVTSLSPPIASRQRRSPTYATASGRPRRGRAAGAGRRAAHRR
jgi:hypothetical protein